MVYLESLLHLRWVVKTKGSITGLPFPPIRYALWRNAQRVPTLTYARAWNSACKDAFIATIRDRCFNNGRNDNQVDGGHDNYCPPRENDRNTSNELLPFLRNERIARNRESILAKRRHQYRDCRQSRD